MGLHGLILLIRATLDVKPLMNITHRFSRNNSNLSDHQYMDISIKNKLS
jgi:hypothetical protein